MPHAAVTPVEALGVDGRRDDACRGSDSPQRPDDPMVVVGRHAIGGTAPGEARRGPGLEIEKRHPVRIVAVNRLADLAPSRHLIDRAGELESKRAGHVQTLFKPVSYCKT